MGERKEVTKKTQVSVFNLSEDEIKTISEKYGLEINKSKGTVWMSLRIPEADTEITWYN